MKTLLLISTLVLSLTALAGGESGGGGAYVRVNGEMVISDLYYKSMGAMIPTPLKAVSYKDFPEAVKRATNHLLAFSSSQLDLRFSDIVTDVGSVYFLVPKELEDRAMCNRYLPQVSVPAENEIQFGCTNGKITYLFVDKFEQASLREQAYALLHERLWTLKENMTQEEVVAIIKGIHTAEDASLNQLSGKLEELSPEEISTIEKLNQVATELGRTDAKAFEITRHGGLVAKDCIHHLSHDFVVGVGSRISCPGTPVMLRSSVLLNTKFNDAHWIENSHLTNVSLFRHASRIMNAKIVDSQLGSLSVNGTEANTVTIKSSHLSGRDLRIAEGANLEKIHVENVDGAITIGKNTFLKHSQFLAYAKMEEDSEGHVVAMMTASLDFAEGTRLSNSTVEFLSAKKSCSGERMIQVGPHGSLKSISGSANDLDGNAFDYKLPCSSMETKISKPSEYYN